MDTNLIFRKTIPNQDSNNIRSRACWSLLSLIFSKSFHFFHLSFVVPIRKSLFQGVAHHVTKYCTSRGSPNDASALYVASRILNSTSHMQETGIPLHEGLIPFGKSRHPPAVTSYPYSKFFSYTLLSDAKAFQISSLSQNARICPPLSSTSSVKQICY